jgi:transaldolase
MPYKVMMQLVEHPLTDIGLKTFQADWEKLQAETR